MDEEPLAVPRVGGGDDEGLALDREAHVADEPFVEDGVHGRAVEAAPPGQAAQGGARRGLDCVVCYSTIAHEW